MKDTYLVVIAVLAMSGYYFFLLPHVEIRKRRVALLGLIRSALSYLFIAGIMLGWFKSASLVSAVLIPLAIYAVVMGIVELLLRDPKTAHA